MINPSSYQAREKLYQIYDALRTLLLNKKYYAFQLHRLRNYSFWMEITIAAGATGSGVAGFAVWQLQEGKLVWGFISGVSVILAIAKPLLRLTERIEEYAKLYGEYTGAFVRVKILVDDIQVDKNLSSARIKLFEELRTRAAELSKLGDPSPKRSLIKRLQDEVNIEITIDALWIPESTNIEFEVLSKRQSQDSDQFNTTNIHGGTQLKWKFPLPRLS
jgi:hypothetical protein